MTTKYAVLFAVDGQWLVGELHDDHVERPLDRIVTRAPDDRVSLMFPCLLTSAIVSPSPGALAVIVAVGRLPVRAMEIYTAKIAAYQLLVKDDPLSAQFYDAIGERRIGIPRLS